MDHGWILEKRGEITSLFFGPEEEDGRELENSIADRVLPGMSVGSSSSQEEVVNTIVSATNLASNHESPRSMERGGGSLSRSSVTVNGSLSQAPNTNSSVVETSPFNPVKSSCSMGESHRDNTHRDLGLRGGSYNGNEHSQSRGPFRRNINGPQPRGNGSVHHSHGGKRDNDRVKQDWSNTHRSCGSRESLETQQRVASRPFIRGPISNPPFIASPPPPMAMRPYGLPEFYNDMPPAHRICFMCLNAIHLCFHLHQSFIPYPILTYLPKLLAK